MTVRDRFTDYGPPVEILNLPDELTDKRSRSKIALRHGDHDQSDHGNRDGSDDDDDREANPYGDGGSVSEYDVDDDGNARFSESYREKYGSIDKEKTIGEDGDLMFVETETGGIHVADDSNGTKDREVVQEFTPRQSGSLGDDIYAVNSGGAARTNGATGVRIEPSGEPTTSGIFAAEGVPHVGTTVTFANGTVADLDAESTFELQEAFAIASGEA